MDAGCSWAVPGDIGPVVAVVGTRGWQCRLCNSTFSRTFSIDHHMVTSHHPLTAQEPQPPSTTTAAIAGGQGAGCTSMEEDNAVQGVSSAGDSGKAGQDEQQRGSCSESMEGVRSAGPGSETLLVAAAAGDADTSSRQDGGSLCIKVEPGLTSCSAPQNAHCQESLPVVFQESLPVVFQESLPVVFQDKSDQRNVSLSAGFKQNMSSSKQSNMDKSNTGVEMTQRDEAGLNSADSCLPHPFRSDDTAGDSWSQFRRQKAMDPPKPYKQRTCSCGQVFQSKHEFRTHRRAVHCKLNHKCFACHICGSEYKYKRGLNRHLAEKGAQSVLCRKCTKQFHDQISFQEHQKLCQGSEMHDGMSSGKERIDDIDQTQTSALKSSEKSSHHEAEDSFPWECSRCKKHFANKSSFRNHLRECGIFNVIDGRRHFTCNLCGRGFHCLVPYHRHYVEDHKLAFLARCADSPVHLSPFTGNSPVASPAPSLTSDINTAMAEVSLQAAAVDVTPHLDTQQGRGMTGEEAASCATSDRQKAAPVCSGSFPSTPAVTASNSSFASIPDSSDTLSLTSACDSLGQTSQMTATSSSEPQSFTSTTSCSNPKSFTSDFSDSCPWSSATSLSGQASEAESIIISDTEETQSSDSSSDSDEDWEVIMGEEEKEDVRKKTGPDTEEHRAAHEGRGPFEHFHPPCGPPPPQHHHCPPPPFPHPRQSFPPPPFFQDSFASFGPRFRPPHHHHHGHHHPGFGGGRFMRWAMFGAGRFGHPGWFSQGDSPSDSQQKAGSTAHATDPNQESSESSQQDDSTTYGQEHSTPFQHAEAFSKWGGKWKEDKRQRKMQKRMMCSMWKNCYTGGHFLFCPECHQSFTDPSELDRHCRDNHPTPAEYTCFICQQAHSQPLSYNKHMKEHFENRLSHRGRGRGHGLIGMGRRFFQQLWKADGPYSLSSPLFGHSHQPQDTDKDPAESEVSAPENFKECPVCNKKYQTNSRESFFERHVNSHHGVEVYSIKCEECGKKFLEKEKFTAHQAKHSASLHVCQTCGKAYQSKTSLKRHERIHTGERPHKCPDCGEGFIELRELERHRRKHTGQDPFQCTVCGKGFTLKDSVLNHVRKKHPGTSPDLCIRRAVPLSEMDHRQQKDTSTAEAQPSTVSVKAEPTEGYTMELD